MGILLIILGIIGLIISGFMFGDIGIAGGIASLTALFSGIGLNGLNGKVKRIASHIKKKEVNDKEEK